MKTLAFIVSLGVGVLASRAPALADDGLPPPPVSMDPGDALNPISIVTGAGVKVGEGTVLHPQVGIETGVVSNVFYQNSGTITAGLLRLLAEVGTGSLPSQRLAIHASPDDQDQAQAQALTLTSPSIGDFQYSANLFASWDQYLSTNNDVAAQGGLGGGLLVRGIVNPQQQLQFAFQEHFTRLIRATNFESGDDTNRDINDLGLRLNYVPAGRSLSGYLYYQNTIDVFEDGSQQFANRMHNVLGLRVNWQWLPLTRVFVNVSQGYLTGIGGSTKVSSFPLTTIAGIQTAMTLNVTLNAHVGYTNGFYASGPSYSTVTGGIMVGYRYSPFGRVTALYDYDHQDSINANFYRDHLFQLSIEQYFVPFVVFVHPELRLRQYDGTIVMGTDGSTTRNDLIVGATAGMRYSFRDWLAGTLDYQLQVIQTDFRYNPGGIGGGAFQDPSYVRHELLVGVRAAY
jgi:hypothetical protein